MELQTKDLDEDELLQLSILASQQDRHDQAISFLKKALEKNPENARITYFLAAEHAQIGLYERAIQGMERTLRLDPEMHIARFQLGMLYLTSGLIQPALAALEPLTQLGENSYLSCFARGLKHLISDEFVECRSLLEQGIALNQGNIPLSGDMQKILELIKDKVPNDGQNTSPSPESTVSTKNPGNLWFSAYQKDDSTEH